MVAEVAPGLFLAGPTLPATCLPLPEVPLLILVGVTGVGKSTALRALGGRALPDRRVLADAVMIRPVAGGDVTDREERFRLTAAYRERHPGGMAEALAGLAVDPAVYAPPLVFDGLRGEDEVRFAAARLPLARFVALHAPDLVRLRRLLGRADAFDRAGEGTADADLLVALRAIPHVGEVFGEADLAAIAAFATQGFDPADVVAKARIVVAERRSYDPEAALGVLRGLPPGRALVIDNGAIGPEEVARRVKAWRGGKIVAEGL